MNHELKIVNRKLNFPRVTLVKPSSHAFLLLAAEVDASPLPVFLGASRRKRSLLAHCKEWCQELEREEGVGSAVVFRAVLIPPGRGRFIQQRRRKVHVARFDVVILIDTLDRESLERVRTSAAYLRMESAVRSASTYVHELRACNVRRINPVDHDTQGIFLFNYFFADDTSQNLAIWEYTAGWFQAETGLNNSTVLLPLAPENARYNIINHCRWDSMAQILPSLLFKRSFEQYVLANFEANHVAAMPILYRLA